MTDLLIEINAEDEGTTADAAALQDSTGTFGVRRKDTQEVIVGSGAAMVQDATNLERWSYNVQGVVPGVTYEWVVRLEWPDAIDYVEFERTIPDDADCAALLTVAQVDALLAVLVPSAELTDWSALSTSDKGVYVCRSQAMIDAGSWDGEKWSETQAYSFPRRDDDGLLIGVENDADPDNPLAPLKVREGLSLLAFSFVDRQDIWERRRSIMSGLASQSAAGISEAYNAGVGGVGGSAAKGDLMAIPDVWTRLGRLWRVGGRII